MKLKGGLTRQHRVLEGAPLNMEAGGGPQSVCWSLMMLKAESNPGACMHALAWYIKVPELGDLLTSILHSVSVLYALKILL